MADYNKAIHLNSQYAIAYYNRGNAYKTKADLDNAIADFSEAIRLNPHYTKAFNNRGEVYFALRQYDQALADFKKANELKPGYNFTLTGLAITHHKQGEVQEATRLWKLLVAMDEGYLDADWVKEELKWRPELVEEARKVIARL